MDRKPGGVLEILLGAAEADKAAQNMQLLLSNAWPQAFKYAQCAVHVPNT